ncbi:MAG: hypothetical protein K2R98_16595 [Gemmataceae bacterium]|nr:hypothetical protein [Gemmataceae bacterium]
MYTSMMLVALAGFPALANVEEGVSWQTDYSQARKQGQSEKKPLAVFVASGKDGWSKVARSGELSKEIEKTLASSYVCVYVDRSTEAGKKLAGALGVEGSLGLVISDASGSLMAFHHDGDLASRDLTRYLTRYADPERTVTQTDTNPPPATRQSYYPPQQQPYTPPINFGGGGRGGC